jgi:hypothetical protein
VLLGVADEQAAIATSAAMQAFRRCGFIIIVLESYVGVTPIRWTLGALKKLRTSLRALRRRERDP